MGWWQALRDQLARLPASQRRFVIIGTTIVFLWFLLNLVVGIGISATRPTGKSIDTVPRYPNATAEVERFDDGLTFADRQYTAETRDTPDAVQAYYRTQMLAKGWQAADPDGRSYTRGPCPIGTFTLITKTEPGGQLTVQAHIITAGRIRAFLPCR